MGVLKCDYRVVGAVQTNCYFLYNPETSECLIIDPGDEADKIINYMQSKELKPVAILLTHGHFDHIGAVDELRDKYNISVYAAKEERETLENEDINRSSFFMGRGLSIAADKWLSDGDEITLLGQNVRCILTPGHTVGGMCFYFPKEMILFSGDTLFQESVGRTDFPGGSMKKLIESIREKIFVLPDEVRVFPGHGPLTSVGDEKMYNPFAV